MTPVVAYLRFSPRPSEKAMTIEVQRGKVEAYASLYELEIVRFRIDRHATAKNLNRPELQAAFADLDQGEVEGLLVAKLDRLTRSVVDMGWLIDHYFEKAYSLFSVAEQVNTKTASGRMVLNILTVIAQWERETISERTSDALQHLKEQGVRLGRPPLGMERTDERDADGRLKVIRNPEELATVERILELHDEGKTLKQIADTLRAEKRPTKRGGWWHPGTVQRILKRKQADKKTKRKRALGGQQ